jgi:hypothetical protein
MNVRIGAISCFENEIIMTKTRCDGNKTRTRLCYWNSLLDASDPACVIQAVLIDRTLTTVEPKWMFEDRTQSS